MPMSSAKLFECKRGHQFESTEPAPKMCPECEAWRIKANKSRYIYNQDRKNASLERRGFITNDRARRCESCNQLMRGFSHLDTDDSTGQKSIVCDTCGYEHNFTPKLSRWDNAGD